MKHGVWQLIFHHTLSSNPLPYVIEVTYRWKAIFLSFQRTVIVNTLL